MPRKALPPQPPFTIAEYEKSTYWKNKAKEILNNKDAQCAICKRKRWKFLKRKGIWVKTKWHFTVHHKTYDNVPNENPEDLQILCWKCHDLCHDILRSEHIGDMYAELATVVRKYFTYDEKSSKNFNTRYYRK